MRLSFLTTRVSLYRSTVKLSMQNILKGLTAKNTYKSLILRMENTGFEPVTSALQGRCNPNDRYLSMSSDELRCTSNMFIFMCFQSIHHSLSFTENQVVSLNCRDELPQTVGQDAPERGRPPGSTAAHARTTRPSSRPAPSVSPPWRA